jgi:uncharacterized membrane protein
MERAGRLIISSIFIIGGMLHFAVPEIYAQIVPPILPHPKALVIISGVAELMGGVGLLLPRCRRAAGCGLALLLVLVFPANIYMAAAHVPATGMLGNCWLQWLRLPLQIPLIWWALHYARPIERGRLNSRANPEKAT